MNIINDLNPTQSYECRRICGKYEGYNKNMIRAHAPKLKEHVHLHSASIIPHEELSKAGTLVAYCEQ